MYQQYMNQVKSSIAQLTSDELKELLNDDDKLEERVTESLSSLENEKSTMLGENRSKAEENLNKEPEIIELRGKVNDLSEEGKLLCESIQQKLSDFKDKSGNMNPETALALLQTAAAEAEEESDKLLKNFLDNELVLDSFLEQFITLRKTMHLRKLKAEKMSDIIQNTQRRTSSYIPQSTGFFNGPPMGTPYPMGGLPYPMGPMGMGMPMPPRQHPF